MLIMAVSGAAVLALVWWAALRERAPAQVIPQTTPERRVEEPSDGDVDEPPSRPLAGAVTMNSDGLHNTTFADADTDQALAAAAALWNVMSQEHE
jgi:hypothetical protein